MPTVRYLGHSAFTITAGDYTLAIDPWLTGNPKAAAKPEQLQVNAILLSHGHSDHVGDAISIAKRCHTPIISTFELGLWAQNHGAQVHQMHIGGAHQFPWGRVKLTPAFHGSAVTEGNQVIYTGEPAGLLINIGGKNIYHAGDTALFSDMQLIGRAGLDLALLPIGDNFTMGIEDAVEAVKFLKPQRVVPMHYNTFPVIAADPHEFAAKVKAETQAECVILEPGASLQV